MKEKDTPSYEYNQQQKDGGRLYKGQVNLESGAIYEGEWLNEMRDGHGK